MAALTDFREALRLELQTDLGIDLVPGMLVLDATKRPRRALGSVWVARKDAADPISDETLEAHVRVYLAFQQSRSQEEPYDPTPLEQLVENIQLSVRDKLTALGPWFLHFSSAELDLEDQGVEVVFLARQLNLAETFG